MEDPTPESPSPHCNHIYYDKSEINVKTETEFLDLASDLNLTTEPCEREQIGGNNLTMKLLKGGAGNCNIQAPVHESDVLDGNHEICADEVQTLPFLQKIGELSNKVLNLKKDHAVLCSEVKGFTADSFPGPEVFSALENLSCEYENLKKKYVEESSERQNLSSENENLKKKYVEESSERKRLYNQVIELKGNIRVFCRCRPLSNDELTSGSSSIVDFDSSQENELQIICSDSSKKQFKFDHVFRPEDGQEAVFSQTSPIVTSVLDGYNVCIFAYGQTGTGKTFTMEGLPENRGVNYRTLEELFRISNERSSVMRYELFVSMLEVYNEKIRDLLIENSNQPVKKLEIKQTAEGTQEVPGLVEARVFGTDEVWELLKSGSRARSVGCTNANELSSRSHCLLRVTVKGKDLINGQTTRSHLWLVDLAGSERVGKIEVEGERLKESQFINKSLSALGDVISALASRTAHIPYRNSKLTHMLQSSLGGDCKTVMIVQISPSSVDLGETLCSLNFASRVRGIEHGPARKQSDLTELLKYKQLAEKSKHDEKETKKLQDSLQCMQLRLAAKDQICKGLHEKNRDLENQLAEERKTRLKQETRAVAAASAQSPALFPAINQAQKKTIAADRRPPLCPSKLRMPLRRISNFLPSSTPVPAYQASTLRHQPARDDKENMSTMTMPSSAKGKTTALSARRGSFVVRPPPTIIQKGLQPRRRASMATLRPETSANVMTPMNTNRLRTDRVVGRQSFVWDPQRVWRTSRVHSPLPQLKEANRMVEATPTAAGSRSSKFMGSPPTQVGSWKPKHPTVVALQRKHLVWSPLKLRGMKSTRRSLLPS